MTNPTPHGQVPEALRLAEYIDDLMDGSMVNYDIDDLEKAAAELRRLHAIETGLLAKVYELQELLKNRDQTATYRTWTAMRDRCERRENARFKRYGGRGIKVCERWQDYANFLQDMGIRPPGKTLDRIDNNGDYEPANCRWATQDEQRRNTSKSRVYEYQGETMCLADWAKRLGISKNTIRSRIDDQGMSFEQAVQTPLQKRSRRD